LGVDDIFGLSAFTFLFFTVHPDYPQRIHPTIL